MNTYNTSLLCYWKMIDLYECLVTLNINTKLILRGLVPFALWNTRNLEGIGWNFRCWSWTNSMMQCCCHLGVISRFYMEPSWPTILLMTGAGVGSVFKVVFWSSNRKLGLWSKQQMATVTQYRNSRLWHAMDFTAHRQKIRTN